MVCCVVLAFQFVPLHPDWFGSLTDALYDSEKLTFLPIGRETPAPRYQDLKLVLGIVVPMFEPGRERLSPNPKLPFTAQIRVRRRFADNVISSSSDPASTPLPPPNPCPSPNSPHAFWKLYFKSSLK